MLSGHQSENDAVIESRSTTKRSYDDTIESCIGNFGWAKFLQVILTSLACFFEAHQTFITIFTDLVPTWHCNTSSSSSSPCLDDKPDVCALPNGAWEWDLPKQAYVVSEWSLECAGPFMTGLPSTSYFIGCLVGGFLLSTFADSTFGRKKMLAFSCLLMNVASVLTAASYNLWMYSFFRFLSGFGRANIGACTLVLSTEVAGRRWRGQVGVLGYVCFTLGFLSLPALAYTNNGSSWRFLYLMTGIAGIIHALLVFFFVHESPRWLYVRGLTGDFVRTIRSIAPPDTRNSITASFFGLFILDQGHEDLEHHRDFYSALKVLLNKGWALRRLAVVMLGTFGFGLVYYGIPLCVDEMPFSIYLSTTLNAVAELPASLITCLVVDNLRRRSSVLGLGFLCGVCSIGCAVLVSDGLKVVQMVLELVAFFSGCAGLNVVIVCTLELFPTCVRNSAVAMARQALVLGGAISPLLVGLGRINRFYSYGVFGLATILCCLFVISLPETFGREMCDTIEEEDSREHQNQSLKVKFLV